MQFKTSFSLLCLRQKRGCNDRSNKSCVSSGNRDSAREHFFFSSRRRHTRWTGDWSSDVCSSDLNGPTALKTSGCTTAASRAAFPRDRKSVVEGKSVDLGGRRIIPKKKGSHAC